MDGTTGLLGLLPFNSRFLMRQIRHIVLHCTATPQTAKVASIENYWRTQLGWKNPGYHVIITPDGVAHTLATDDTICNGVAGHNATSLHVSYIGGVNAKNVPVDNRTAAQRTTMERVVREWLVKYPNAEVLGHRDFGAKKACPSFDARAWWQSVGALLVMMILALGGTGCQRKLTEGVQIQDSTTVTESVRYVPVSVPGDTVRQYYQIDCDPVTLKPLPFSTHANGAGGRASQTLTLDAHGQLMATATCDAWRDSVAVRDRLINRLRNEKRTVVQEVPTTRWYDMAARWLLGFLLIPIGFYFLLNRR